MEKSQVITYKDLKWNQPTYQPITVSLTRKAQLWWVKTNMLSEQKLVCEWTHLYNNYLAIRQFVCKYLYTSLENGAWRIKKSCVHTVKRVGHCWKCFDAWNKIIEAPSLFSICVLCSYCHWPHSKKILSLVSCSVSVCLHVSIGPCGFSLGAPGSHHNCSCLWLWV